jgi:uncharacterized protein YjbI with pentapeptide repeats
VNVAEFALRSRWADSPQLVESALDLLQGGGKSVPPFGRVKGRLDLRGLILRPPKEQPAAYMSSAADDDQVLSIVNRLTEPLEIRGQTLTGIDLTAAVLPSLRLHDVRVVDCVFDQADCRDWRAWQASWLKCTFRETNFEGSNLGIWWDGKRSDFLACDFEGADLSSLDFSHVHFEDCTFGPRAIMANCHFEACSVAGCVFDGSLEEAVFDHCDLRDVDFSGADFEWTEFRGSTLDRVLPPPTDPEHVVVHHFWAVVHQALERLASETDEDYAPLRRRLGVELRNAEDGREFGVWHVIEIGSTRVQQAKARALLEALDAALRDGGP